MEMYFTLHTSSYILFKKWQSFGWLGYSASCFGVFLWALFHEFSLSVQNTIKNIDKRNFSPKRRSALIAANLLRKLPGAMAEIVLFTWLITQAYCLMLVCMTYSVGLFFSVVLGHSAGFFIFRNGSTLSMKSKQVADHKAMSGIHERIITAQDSNTVD